MTAGRIRVQQRIAASGPLVLRRADGAVPTGYKAWGQHWAVAFPDDLKSAELSETFLGIAIGTSEENDQDNAEVGITRFWDEAIRALLPIPEARIPLSETGLAAGALLASPVANERGRAAQIERHLVAMATRRPAAPHVPAFADLLLRQISVLQLPADATATFQRRDDGGWLLEFRESGSLGCLLGDLGWVTPNVKDKAEKRECQPQVRQNAYETGGLIALARAIQLALLAIGSGLDSHLGLRVEVWNADLGHMKMGLEIGPEDRGLALARLARQVAIDLKLKKLGQALELMPCRPSLFHDQKEAAFFGDEPRKSAEPLRWHDQEGMPPFRWVYSGDHATSRHYPKGLPFALIPESPVGEFAALSKLDRVDYLDWLTGPRRAAGCRPEFIRLYLQGLEYRILADGAPSEEVFVLVGEIRALRALAVDDDVLSAQLDSLLDWLGATGKCPLGPLIAEGPLTCLVSYGRTVAQGNPLTVVDLALLNKLIGETEQHNLPEPELSDPPSEGVILLPPQKPLTADYASISGLCNQQRHLFLHNGRPLPDLRSSMRLRAILAGLRRDEEGSRR